MHLIFSLASSPRKHYVLAILYSFTEFTIYILICFSNFQYRAGVAAVSVGFFIFCISDDVSELTAIVSIPFPVLLSWAKISRFFLNVKP